MTKASLAQALREEAENHILPFWMKLKDIDKGGLYGSVNYELEVDMKSNKGGIATARQLWSFSRAYNDLGHEYYLEMAKHIFKFMKKSIMDTEYGGIFWMVDYQGKVTDDRKHVYAQAFAIYALSEYYKASDEKEALDMAYDLYQIVETKGYRKELDVYGEEYTREWVEQGNEMLSENGVSASITTNTLLHILEAYTLFYEVTLDKSVKNALLRLINLFINKIWNWKTNHMSIFFDKDWKEMIDLQSFGHDIEATWLLNLALDVLEKNGPVGDGFEEEILSKGNTFVERIAETIYSKALDTDGSMYNESEKSKVDKTKIWWVQAEAMVGFYNMYQRTKDQKWFEATERVWSFIQNEVVDPRQGGEWLYSIEANGSKTQRQIAEPWKTPYHNTRACLEIYRRCKVN